MLLTQPVSNDPDPPSERVSCPKQQIVAPTSIVLSPPSPPSMIGLSNKMSESNRPHSGLAARRRLLQKPTSPPHPLSIVRVPDTCDTPVHDLISAQIPVGGPGNLAEIAKPRDSSDTDLLPLPTDRPGMMRFHSSPAVPCLSPTRQQFRIPNSSPRMIKETLNASMKIDAGEKTINQYLLKQEVGRGSFGTVWLVLDTTTNEQFVSSQEYCYIHV